MSSVACGEAAKLMRIWNETLVSRVPQDPNLPKEVALELVESMHELAFLAPGQPVPLTPMIMNANQIAQIQNVVGSIARLIERTVEDLLREPSIVQQLGLGDAPYESFMHPCPSSKLATSMLRADVMCTDRVPKVIEVNFNSLLGGTTETVVLNDAFLNGRAGILLSDTINLCGDSLFSARLHTVTSIMQNITKRRCPVVGILGLREEYVGQFARFFAEELAYLRAHGVVAMFADPGEVEIVAGKLYARGCRLDAVIRQYQISDARRAGRDIEHLRALEQQATHTLFYTTQHSHLYSSKYVLAELHRRAHTLPHQERRLVEAHVPWTALLRDGPAKRGDKAINVASYALSNRESLVMKPINANMGRDVVIGRDVAQRAWEDLIDVAVSRNDRVIQEFVESDLWPMLTYDTTQNCVNQQWVWCVLGPYRMGGVSASIIARQRNFEDETHMLNWDQDGTMNVLVTGSESTQ